MPQKFDFLNKIKPYIEGQEEDCYILNNQYYHFMSLRIGGMTNINVVIRSRILGKSKILFNEEMLFGEDADLWYRLIMNNRSIFIKQVLSVYRRHEDNITNNYEKCHLSFVGVRTKNYNRGKRFLNCEERLNLRKQISEAYKDLAYFYFQKYKIKQARSMYLKSFLWHPFVLRNWLGFIKTFVPKFIVKRYRDRLKK